MGREQTWPDYLRRPTPARPVLLLDGRMGGRALIQNRQQIHSYTGGSVPGEDSEVLLESTMKERQDDTTAQGPLIAHVLGGEQGAGVGDGSSSSPRGIPRQQVLSALSELLGIKWLQKWLERWSLGTECKHEQKGKRQRGEDRGGHAEVGHGEGCPQHSLGFSFCSQRSQNKGHRHPLVDAECLP